MRQAKKAERAKDKSLKPKEKDKEKDKSVASKLQNEFDGIDLKERSKERKKNIEENRGKVDNKRVNAMAELKARREGKIKREEAEEERKKKKEEEEQKKKEEEEAEPNKPETKLKASDIYSDDSDDDGKCYIDLIYLHVLDDRKIKIHLYIINLNLHICICPFFSQVFPIS